MHLWRNSIARAVRNKGGSMPAEHPSTILPLFGVFRRRANWLIYSGSNRGPIDDRRMEERERERERPLIGFIET